MMGDDGATPIEMYITDRGVYEFLQQMPNMEFLHCSPCCNISGEIFSKIGEFPSLRVFHLDRRASNAELVDPCSEFHFGGGVLPKLESLDIGMGWYQQERGLAGRTGRGKGGYRKTVTFPPSKLLAAELLQMAPNLTSINFLADVEDVDMVEVTRELIGILKIQPIPAMRGKSTLFTQDKIDIVDMLLEHSQIVTNMNLCGVMQALDWKKYERPLPSVTSLYLEKTTDPEVYKKLTQLFPSLTSLTFENFNIPPEMLNLLLDVSVWPDLKSVQPSGTPSWKEVLEVRPFLISQVDMWDGREMRQQFKVGNASQQFIKDWTVWDEVGQIHPWCSVEELLRVQEI